MVYIGALALSMMFTVYTFHEKMTYQSALAGILERLYDMKLDSQDWEVMNGTYIPSGSYETIHFAYIAYKGNI